MADSDSTLLTVTGIQGIPEFSSRGMTATLEPIDAAFDVHRTINGELLDFGFDQFRKYRISITGTDQVPPAFDKLWPGMPITVNLISELAYLTGTPGRPIARTRNEESPSSWKYYAPTLVCLVTGWDTDTDEYGASVGWTLNAEEV